MTSVFLTAENNDSGVKIFGGFVFNKTDLRDSECKIERADEGQALLNCGNLSLATRFAENRDSALNVQEELIILNGPDKKENYIFEALDKTVLNIYLGQNKKFQKQLEIASCLQDLECHYQDSNVCRNIVVANEKKHCTSTCASVPQTKKPLTSETLNLQLQMKLALKDHQRRTELMWTDDIVKYETRKNRSTSLVKKQGQNANQRGNQSAK